MAAKKVKTGQQLRRKVVANNLKKEGSEGITKRTIKQQGGRRPNPTEKKRTNSQQDNQPKGGINLRTRRSLEALVPKTFQSSWMYAKDANEEREVATKLCGTWDQIPSLLSQVKTNI